MQFAGFILSADGYRTDPAITDAIEQFPTPTNRTDLRSFFGLVNQLSACTDTIAPLLAPLRPLLSIKNDFVWTPNHDLAFGKAKESLIPPHLPFPFLMLTGKRGCVLMLVARGSDSFYSKDKVTLGNWSKLVQDSCQVRSPDMPSLNWNY